jgi:hypothetical protein
MIKQFLKIAGVKTEKDLLRKYGTEDAFFAAHPEAEMLVQAAMGGSYYQDGGSPLYSTQGQALRNFMNTVAYSKGGWMPNHIQLPPVGRFDEGGQADPEAAMVQQGPPPPNEGQAGSDQQLQEVIKMIVEALQQGMAPEQVIAKLVEMGVPEAQAGELVQGVMQQLQGGGQQGAPEEMMQGQPPMGRYGGMYAAGGEPCPGRNQIRNEEGTCVCAPGFDTDEMSGECIPSGQGNQGETTQNQEGLMPPPPGMPRSAPIPRGGFNANFGLQGNRYNLDYGFGVGADMQSNVRHNLNLNFPGAFRMGENKGDLGVAGSYLPGRSWSGNLTAGIPLSGIKGRGDLLRFTGGMNQQFNDPELNSAMNSNAEDFMKVNQKKNPIGFNAGVEYLGKVFGEKGPTVKIGASYDRQRKYGGLSKFVDGGAPQQGGQEQQLMQQVAQALQQGAQPEQVMQQLVQMGMPQEQAQQLIQMIMQQMQGGGQGQPPMQMYGGEMYANGGDTDNGTYYQGMYMAYGGPYIPLYSGGGDNNYSKGGSVKKYKKGGEYEMSDNEIQDLIKKGYKIQYL